MTTTIRAYRGPNGWYTAEDDAAGFHHQPAHGGRYESAQEAMTAHREAEVSPATCMTTQTIAERFSAELDNDGQRWETRKGVSFTQLLDKYGADASYANRGIADAAISYTFDDDSIITACGPAWGFGFADCYCWTGGGHTDECLESSGAEVSR